MQDTVDIEGVLNLNPDLIIISKTQEKMYEQLKSIAPTIMIELEQIDWKKDILKVASILNKEDAANKWLENYESNAKQKGNEIKEKYGNETTYLSILASGGQIFVFDSAGVGGILYEDMGLNKPAKLPVQDTISLPVVSYEGLLEIDSDYIILIGTDEDINALKQSPIYNNLNAVKNNNVIELVMKISKRLISITGFILLLIGILVSINIGAKDIPLKNVFNSIFFYDGSVEAQLIRDVRLPRVISALLNGGILSICGAMIQGVMRNPLADPSIIGITQGATLAIALSTIFPIGLGIYGNFFMALIGSAFSGIIVLIIMKNSSLNHNISKLLLASTAMSTLFISIASMIALIKNKSQELAFWISGSLNQNGWLQVISLIIIGSIFCFLSILMINDLNILNLGDENTIGLGVSPSKVRLKIISIIIPLCSICVATSGNISFIGLLVPHIIKKLVGTNYKDVLPLSFLFGSALLIFSDIIARTILSPYELPIGIFTSFIGIPIFLLLIRKENI